MGDFLFTGVYFSTTKETGNRNNEKIEILKNFKAISTSFGLKMLGSNKNIRAQKTCSCEAWWWYGDHLGWVQSAFIWSFKGKIHYF